MFDIDLIIPCYGKSEIIDRGLASIATQWKNEFIHVTLVNDCSPNTDCNYQDLVDHYKDQIDIRCIKTPRNGGQGLARQYGIDNTKRQWFMFMDEDDRFGDNLAVSLFIGAAESYNYKKDKYGNILINKKGKPMIDKNVPQLALVSGPLFEFDDNHTHVIESTNHVWLNSKLYNREFLKKHNIKFNKEQSRHAEDYYFTSCFFFALDHDLEYMGILLDNETRYYLWYPNMGSQSRVDPNYGYMLSGYTMDASVNILKYMKNQRVSKIPLTKEVRDRYTYQLLNMTVYSYYTFMSFIRHVGDSDYVPKLEEDWTILRDACATLRKMTLENWDKYSYIRKIEELFLVKNNTDVIYSEPWIEFDKYITDGTEEFEWSFEDLMKLKESDRFPKKEN